MDFKHGDYVMHRPSVCKYSGRPNGALKFTYIQINYITTFKFIKEGPNIRTKQCLLPLRVFLYVLSLKMTQMGRNILLY